MNKFSVYSVEFGCFLFAGFGVFESNSEPWGVDYCAFIDFESFVCYPAYVCGSFLNSASENA